MYSTLSSLEGRKHRRRALHDGTLAAVSEANRIGGASICRYGDAVIERIEFDITHRNRMAAEPTGTAGASKTNHRTAAR